MTAEEWADNAASAYEPWIRAEHGYAPTAMTETEAWTLIRAMYVDGYVDAHRGDNPASIMDAHRYEARLRLMIPVG